MKKNNPYNNIAIQQWINIFALATILFLPFPFVLFPFHSDLVHFLFEDILVWFGKILFNISLKNPEISSDSTLLYLQILFLGITSLFLATALSFSTWFQKSKTIFNTFCHQVFAYYLAFQLLNYGFDKLFKAQFYLPEPNTLYTPFGQMSKDLLFWSTMGISYEYNVFMALMEIIPALLIFFRKTRAFGVLIALGVLSNVLAINFSFDISVKVYSLFLCFLCLVLLSPYLTSLYNFFITQKETRLEKNSLSPTLFKSKVLKFTLKTFVIGIIFLEVLFPFLKSGNFNDDLVARPFLHGAYEIQTVFENDKKIEIRQFPIKKIFIHRQGFLIFQSQDDKMQDFKVNINKTKKLLLLQDYHNNNSLLKYKFYPKKQILELEFEQHNKIYKVKSKALNWEKLPALQKDFHWSIDNF